MANLYSPESLGIKAPKEGFQQGGWYSGRQYWGGQLSDPGVINPLSNQVGAGQAVSAEVNAQSAQAQGVAPQQLESYLQQQRDTQAKNKVVASGNVNPTATPTPARNDSGMDYDTGLPVATTTQTTLNLPNLYKSLYETSGVSALQDQITKKTESYNEAQSKINDNPFLSEATRTGRISKLTTDYNNAIKNDQDSLEMKQADIEMQLNLATKQFDIESQQAQQALEQFNTLLSSGALAGASGADIASITKATGISSNMIQSAINAKKEKDIETSVSTVDDGTNIYSVVIDSKTGKVISKQVLSKSKPTASDKEKEPTAEEAKASVRLTISDYIANQNYQNQISPEDLYRKLIQEFPLAYEYIDENWTPEQIRIANGETNPYGKN